MLKLFSKFNIVSKRKELGVESKGMLIIPTKNKYGFATKKNVFLLINNSIDTTTYIAQQHFRFPCGFI
jgi:hypothetical protein